HPASADDKKRVQDRMTKVESTGAAAGEQRLKNVQRLLDNGKLAAALHQCDEEAVSNWKGFEVWYRLLEKADQGEDVIDQRVPKDLRPCARRQHARQKPENLKPENLASLPPPEPETAASESLGSAGGGTARPPPRPVERDPLADAQAELLALDFGK